MFVRNFTCQPLHELQPSLVSPLFNTTSDILSKRTKIKSKVTKSNEMWLKSFGAGKWREQKWKLKDKRRRRSNNGRNHRWTHRAQVWTISWNNYCITLKYKMITFIFWLINYSCSGDWPWNSSLFLTFCVKGRMFVLNVSIWILNQVHWICHMP